MGGGGERGEIIRGNSKFSVFNISRIFEISKIRGNFHYQEIFDRKALIKRKLLTHSTTNPTSSFERNRKGIWEASIFFTSHFTWLFSIIIFWTNVGTTLSCIVLIYASLPSNSGSYQAAGGTDVSNKCKAYDSK